MNPYVAATMADWGKHGALHTSIPRAAGPALGLSSPAGMAGTYRLFDAVLSMFRLQICFLRSWAEPMKLVLDRQSLSRSAYAVLSGAIHACLQGSNMLISHPWRLTCFW